MPKNTDDLRIRELKELTPPSHLIREFPCSDAVSDLIYQSRNAMHRILHGMDDRLIVKHGGYRKLKSFQVAQLVYDVTDRKSVV